MKTLHLVKSLTRSEQSVFESGIKNKGRKPLILLWRYLLKYEGDKPEKADMYRAAFKTKYNSTKDYKLRNELRLLSEELTDYIIHKSIEDEMKNNPHYRHLQYLKALRKRDLDQVFMPEYDKLFAKAETEMEIELAEEMAQEKMLFLNFLLETHFNDFQLLYEHAEFYVERVRRRAQHAIRLAEFKRDLARSRWETNPINKDVSVPDRILPRDTLHIKDQPNDVAITLFYSKFSQALYADANNRIPILEEALDLIEKCNYPGIEYHRLKARCLNGIGITYHQLNEADKEFDAFRKSIELFESAGIKSITYGLMNYLLGLIHQKRTEEFWKVLEQYKHWFDNPGKLEVLNRIMQFAHTEAGSYEDSLNVLKDLKVHTDTEYLMVKSALVATYYHMKEFESVITESNNALHFLRTREMNVFRYLCHEFEFKLTTLLAKYEMVLPEEKSDIIVKIEHLLNTVDSDIKWHMTAQFLRSKWVIERAEAIVMANASSVIM
ncbi:MAG: hypothetical protein R2730_11805 [Chitinophagales bacterium]